METALPVVTDTIPEATTPDINNLKYAPLGIPIERIVDLYLQGLSKAEIARQLNCSNANITTRLQAYEEDIEALPTFKKNKADLLAMYQRRILNSLTLDDIKDQSAYQRVGMFAILYDKERLERDLSTENVSHEVLVSSTQDAKAEYDKARDARLAAQSTDPE